MKYRVQEAWESFAKAVLPRDCSAVQKQEMRRAFHAGAFVVLDVMSADMSNEDHMTAGDEQILVDLAAEQELYLADLKAGRA